MFETAATAHHHPRNAVRQKTEGDTPTGSGVATSPRSGRGCDPTARRGNSGITITAGATAATATTYTAENSTTDTTTAAADTSTAAISTAADLFNSWNATTAYCITAGATVATPPPC